MAGSQHRLRPPRRLEQPTPPHEPHSFAQHTPSAALLTPAMHSVRFIYYTSMLKQILAREPVLATAGHLGRCPRSLVPVACGTSDAKEDLCGARFGSW